MSIRVFLGCNILYINSNVYDKKSKKEKNIKIKNKDVRIGWQFKV